MKLGKVKLSQIELRLLRLKTGSFDQSLAEIFVNHLHNRVLFVLVVRCFLVKLYYRSIIDLDDSFNNHNENHQIYFLQGATESDQITVLFDSSLQDRR